MQTRPQPGQIRGRAVYYDGNPPIRPLADDEPAPGSVGLVAQKDPALPAFQNIRHIGAGLIVRRAAPMRHPDDLFH